MFDKPQKQRQPGKLSALIHLPKILAIWCVRLLCDGEKCVMLLCE